MLEEQASSLGKPFAELTGKVMVQRVLDGNGTVETAVSVRGLYREIQVKATKTFYGTPTSNGTLRGKGKGLIMTLSGEPEMATYTGEAIGRLGQGGSVKWQGAIFYSTSSTGRLAFLNNLVGIFKSEFDTEGNFSEKIWEWK
jgi:hypothetical protein